jgi:hypothetical protein
MTESVESPTTSTLQPLPNDSARPSVRKSVTDAQGNEDVTAHLDLSVELTPTQAMQLNELAARVKMAFAMIAMKGLGRAMDDSENPTNATEREKESQEDEEGLKYVACFRILGDNHNLSSSCLLFTF